MTHGSSKTSGLDLATFNKTWLRMRLAESYRYYCPCNFSNWLAAYRNGCLQDTSNAAAKWMLLTDSLLAKLQEGQWQDPDKPSCCSCLCNADSVVRHVPLYKLSPGQELSRKG